jgi:hypothetical protein
MPRYVAAPAPELTGWHPEAQIHVTMSPDAFTHALWEAMEGFETFMDQEVVEKLKQRMITRQEIDPAYIDYDPYKNVVVKHEGRHRAMAAKQLGIDMPVIVYMYDSRKDGQKHEVKNQWGEVYDYTRYVSLEELGPARVDKIVHRLGATRTSTFRHPRVYGPQRARIYGPQRARIYGPVSVRRYRRRR